MGRTRDDVAQGGDCREAVPTGMRTHGRTDGTGPQHRRGLTAAIASNPSASARATEANRPVSTGLGYLGMTEGSMSASS